MNERKIAAYIRVSTEEQTKGFSLDVQREKLIQYCKFKDWENIKWYADEGFTGGNMKRPALKRMLNAIKRNEISTVVTYKADRLSRRLRDMLIIIEDILETRDVAFISATEDFDSSSPTGKAFLQLLGTMSELEINNIKTRTLSGRKKKASIGGFACGEPPYGYISVNKGLVIDEARAEIVRKMYNMRKSGISINMITKELNRLKIPGPRAAKWWPSSVRYILKNQIYRGVLRQSINGDVFENKLIELCIIK